MFRLEPCLLTYLFNPNISATEGCGARIAARGRGWGVTMRVLQHNQILIMLLHKINICIILFHSINLKSQRKYINLESQTRKCV